MRIGVLVAIIASGCANGSAASPDAGPSVDAYEMPVSACGVLPCDAIYVSRSGNDTATGDKGVSAGAGLPVCASAGKPCRHAAKVSLGCLTYV